METEKLQPADLDIDLQYPQGPGGSPYARIVVRCRKSRAVVAEIDMTPLDLANFFARRVTGEREGATRLAASHMLSVLNHERTYVQVNYPGVWLRSDPKEENHPENWAAEAARAFGIQHYRVNHNRDGWKISFYFHFPQVTEVERAYVQRVGRRLQDLANQVASR